MHSIARQLTDLLYRRREATRLVDWPEGAPLSIALFTSAADPPHLALALDAIETFHPGSAVDVYADGPLTLDALAHDPPLDPARLRVAFHPLAESTLTVAAPRDLLILLHPWPWPDEERLRRLGPVRRAFRRAAARSGPARRWILFRDLFLWDGSVRAALMRRLIDLPMRPAARLADRADAARLQRRVLPGLAAAEGWNGETPCDHPRRRRVFDSPRRVDFCPDCGMGLTPAAAVLPAEETFHLYGPGYARYGRYTGRREFHRFVRENLARVGGYLKALDFPETPPAAPGAPPPRVLDLGCGNGRFAPLWLARGWRYLGVDPSPHNIEFARNLAAELAPGGDAEFLTGTLGSPRLAEAAPFDALFLSHVLEHVPDPVAMLAELRRLTRPGGWIYVEVPDGPRYAWNLRHRGYANPEHLWDFTPAMLAALARQAGWREARTHRDPDGDLSPFVALLARNEFA